MPCSGEFLKILFGFECGFWVVLDKRGKIREGRVSQ